MKPYAILTALIGAIALCGAASASDAPAPINSYSIHADGGLIYNPLSNMARSTGRLAEHGPRARA